jgi:hypothetical protein
LPPSAIADTWSIDELLNAEALARLEGWGQERRRTASILAELHNVSRVESWALNDDRNAPYPKLLSEGDFLPRRVKRRKSEQPATPEAKQQIALSNLASVMNGMCGYR